MFLDICGPRGGRSFGWFSLIFGFLGFAGPFRPAGQGNHLHFLGYAVDRFTGTLVAQSCLILRHVCIVLLLAVDPLLVPNTINLNEANTSYALLNSIP